jgi:hypothetical protein
VRPDGWLLVAFHIDSAEFASGDPNHLSNWFGEPVDIVMHFLEPADVVRDIEAAGFAVMSTVIRQPMARRRVPEPALLRPRATTRSLKVSC